MIKWENHWVELIRRQERCCKSSFQWQGESEEDKRPPFLCRKLDSKVDKKQLILVFWFREMDDFYDSFGREVDSLTAEGKTDIPPKDAQIKIFDIHGDPLHIYELSGIQLSKVIWDDSEAWATLTYKTLDVFLRGHDF
jgi:hypothetical protein